MADEKSDEKYTGNITRRTVIATAATAAFVPVTAIRSAAQSVAPAARTFSPDQRRTLEAFIDRICPKDELGPGAVEIGAADYMEVQLGDYLKSEKQTFLDGLAAVDAYARANYAGPFADLSADKRDAVLTDIDSGKANDLEGVLHARAPAGRSKACVRRSALRREQELRRMGSDQLPGPAPRDHRRHAEDERSGRAVSSLGLGRRRS